MNNDSIEIEKPLLKWVGGKTQILEKVLSNFPKKINSYHEIFLGGGSVLFGFLAYVNNKKIKIDGNIFAYDLNSTLIAFYKNIQSKRVELYDEIIKIIEPYHKLFEKDEDDTSDEETEDEKNDSHKSTPESYYYEIRKKFNKLTEEEKKSVKGSAMFLFLNKTCFRGLYRVGPNGFNVPYGNYKKPEIINKNHYIRIHKLIRNVEFREGDFKTSMKNIKQNDFTYLDPPYAPESKTSFVKYNKGGFSIENNKELFKLCNEFGKKKIKFLMSNSNVEIVINSFPEGIFNIEKINCKRSINSKKPGSKTIEVLIKN
jgi:DNA adenine methylase